MRDMAPFSSSFSLRWNFGLILLGVLADVTAVNRRILDELRARERERVLR